MPYFGNSTIFVYFLWSSLWICCDVRCVLFTVTPGRRGALFLPWGDRCKYLVKYSSKSNTSKNKTLIWLLCQVSVQRRTLIRLLLNWEKHKQGLWYINFNYDMMLKIRPNSTLQLQLFLVLMNVSEQSFPN